MPLNSQAEAFIKAMPDINIKAQIVQEMRRQRSALISQNLTYDIDKEDVIIYGGDGEDLKVRIYRPRINGPYRCLVYFHGGGWVMCSIETHDDICARLCEKSGWAVVSVEYRLAPEHHFPAQLKDAGTALTWLTDNAGKLNIRRDSIGVGGDSSGANLAAALTLKAKETGQNLLCQILLYPTLNYHFETASYRDYGEGYYLTKEHSKFFWDCYLCKESDVRNPFASPMLAEDFTKLPQAMIVTAEYDPLRDDGEIYAEKLTGAGVPVCLKRYDGMIHGFINALNFIDYGKSAVDDIAEYMSGITVPIKDPDM